MQMELISRKEFDSRVTSGELDNLQAIKVKEGFCLIGNQSGTNRVFMLRRTDLKPFVWKNEIGPSSYAQTRGCHNLAFFYKDELSVVDIQGLPNCSQARCAEKHTEVEALAGDVPGK